VDIKTVLELEPGVSNIGIEGEVTYAMTPRNVTGDNEKGHYDFWSQFIVIEDETGKIGCSISIEKEEYKLVKGVVARVKGKLEEYKNKNGETVRKLKGKLIAISKGDKVTDVQQERAEGYFEEKRKEEEIETSVEAQTYAFDELEKKDPMYKKVAKPADSVWEAKDLRIARECAVKAVTELICAKIMKSKDFFTFADTIVKYIYNGLPKVPDVNKPTKPTKAENIALARHIAGGGKLELKEGKKGLLEEDDEKPGSSPNNAIPYKGKRKKINKAEDFVNEEDSWDDIPPEDLPE